MSEVIIRGGTILCVDAEHNIVRGDLAIVDGRIVQVGGQYVATTKSYEIIDAAGAIVMPGLVQSHIHMCQTLARGRADDMQLLDWLQKVVWPYEGAMEAADVAAAAELACLELLVGGTTAILDMGTVHHSDELFRAAQKSGLRASIGKAMMDAPDELIPPGLRESTSDSIAESKRLHRDWHERANGRLRYAFAPRFALSCTDELLAETAKLGKELGLLVHTHASENRDEIVEVKRRTGKDNIMHLADLGLSGPNTALAHCVWLNDAEREVLADSGTKLLHCPSSNLKLSSGIAEIPELIQAGVEVSIGADGAPCNNNLDGFVEMRLAALIHKPRAGSSAMKASQVLELATMGGARALGLEDEIGSIEVGKRGDVIVVDTNTPHAVPSRDPYSTIAYACQSRDVRHTIVDGNIVVRDRQILSLDQEQVLKVAQERADRLFASL